MKRNKKSFSFLEVSVIVVLVSFVMSFLGASLVYRQLGGVNFSLLNEDQGLRELIGAYNNLLDNYYDELDTKDLIDGAISGMYAVVGDPYTTYLDENSTNSLEDSLNGKYKGIGVKIGMEEDKLIIFEVFEGSPALMAGIEVGDVVIKIDEESTEGMSTEDLSNKIKDKKSFKLTVNRNNEIKEFDLNTSSLVVPVVNSSVLNYNDKRIGYIQLTVFNDTSDEQFSQHLNSLEQKGIDSLIVDLRNNSGGYLQMAENIAELFIEKGKVIYSLENKSSKEETKDETNEKRDYRVDILVNKGSASASEILAAALKYSQGAKLVGNTTYGKGKVQERSNLSNGTEVKYTTARWLTPKGDCIDGVGLEPDIQVDFNVDNYNQENILTDTQVMQALEDLTH